MRGVELRRDEGADFEFCSCSMLCMSMIVCWTYHSDKNLLLPVCLCVNFLDRHTAYIKLLESIQIKCCCKN